MNLQDESERLDHALASAYIGWRTQLEDIEESIKILNNTLANVEKTDLSENATYSIARDERDLKIASKALLMDKIEAYDADRKEYQPVGIIKLGTTCYIEPVTVNGNTATISFPPFKIVSDELSSATAGLVSIKTPVGSNLIGLHAGDVFEVITQVGIVKYKVKEVY